jgi:hypothetical protein
LIFRTKHFQVCTSSGGWTSKSEDTNGLPFSWATEYMEGETAAPNGMAIRSASSEKCQHRVAEKVDSKDIEMAEHV